MRHAWILFCVSWMASPASALDGGAPLWLGLEPGPHAVGYRSIVAHDPSRPALTPTADSTAGRAMRIGVWYPARRSTGSPIPFERYLEDAARSTGTRAGVDARRAGIDLFVAGAVGLGGHPDTIRARLPALLATRTAASTDASPSPGQFPLVLFPEYGAPHGASVLGEYLASHGYVVATVGMLGTLDPDYDLGVAGLETQVHDLQIVLRTLLTGPGVAPGGFAAVGVGINANATLALQMRDPRVQALVSLDGGLLSPTEHGLTRRGPYWDPWAVTVPLLAIWSPHPSLDPSLLDTYRYSERLIVHYPRMAEFHYLAYGAIEAVIPSVIGPAPRDVRAAFPSAYRQIRAFLDTHLAKRSTPQPPDGAGPDSLYVVSRRPALPRPPSLAEIKRILTASGGDSLARHWRELRRVDPEPISLQRFTQVLNWIRNVYTGDRDGRMRRSVLELRLEAHPDSWRAHAGLAQAAHAAGERELARTRARDALRLFDDHDPDLPASQRGAIRAQLEQLARDD